MPTNPANDLMIGAANRLIANIQPEPLSKEAVNRVHSYVARFIDDLVLESVIVMRSRGATQVSSDFVDDAARNLRSRRKTLTLSLLKVGGGTCLGLAGKMVWDILRSGSPVQPVEVLFAVIFAAIGGILVAYVETRGA